MKKLLFVLLILCCGITVVGCKDDSVDSESEKDLIPEIGRRSQGDEEILESEPIDEIQKQIDEMTIEEKIGQLVIVGLDGTTIDDSISVLIRDRYVGGIILFSNNIEGLTGVNTLINNLKELNKDNNVPLFISVDEEGGLVSRTPDEFSKLPSSIYIGKLNDDNLSYEVGEILAEQLRVIGYNMDYAPVLDILSNPNNTVIGNRAFGRDFETVSKIGVSTMVGIQDNGVIPVVKHFPGHGDTTVDSHYGLPLVEKTKEELMVSELIPFKDAIDSGADAVMVAHILVSSIDSEYPASMSSNIINDLLRKEMDFDGVVITDDMTMGAIINNYDIGEAAIKSVNSGADIMLVCHGYDNENKVIDSIINAVNDSIISEDRINESVYRILSLKSKYNLTDDSVDLKEDLSEINDKIKNIREKVNMN